MSFLFSALSAVLLGAACVVARAPAQGSADLTGQAYRADIEQAHQAIAAHRYGAAWAELTAAVTLQPKRAEGWEQMGVLEERLSDFRGAEATLRRAVELDPQVATTHYLLGLSLIANPGEKLDWPGAIAEFTEALKLRPQYAEAADYLGVGQTAIGQVDAAIKTLQSAISIDPAQPAPHFNLALALERQGQIDAAAGEYRKALELRPTYSEADSALGKLLLTQGHLEEAEARLRNALRTNPDLEDAHYALARVLRKQKKLDAAQVEFAEALDLGQREQHGIESSKLSNGALERAGKGELAAAEADLRRAIALRADYGVPHYNLGLILADEQHDAEAGQQMLLAISLMPGRAQLWISLAKLQARACDVEGAGRSLDWAFKLAPGLVSAQRQIATLSAACTKTAGPLLIGLKPWTTSVEDEGDTPASHDRYASQLQAAGQWLAASGEWLRSLKLDPASAPARLALAECLEHLGDREHAILEERKALLAAPTSAAAHLALGLSLRANGSASSAEARAQLEQALALDPNAHAAADALKALPPP